ncbi:Fur family transcriptional regulator [Kribbia dieselivorans]|uniref:Fur family transcriptional regulator n=1 Tax=Kribbia dieselivorans TaxID=331526 RepID=UPI0008388A19|nr:Fur family transcriptional regulator [Kribbia dieselivorans]
MADVANLLRGAGMRMTQQRHRVVRAVELHPHSTPEELVEAVGADGGPSMPPSTIYRTLEALQKVGVVDHTHLDHGPPTYHLAGTHGHLHLVCRNCSAVEEVPASLAEVLVHRLRGFTDFAPDPTHMAIHGYCAACQEVLP